MFEELIKQAETDEAKDIVLGKILDEIFSHWKETNNLLERIAQSFEADDV